MSKIDVLGVLIDDLTMKGTIEEVKEFLQDGRQHQIVTPNPEHIILAQEDLGFRKILNKADLAIPDGVGVVWASKTQNPKPKSQNYPSASLGSRAKSRDKSKIKSLRERVTGTDLMLKLCELAAQKGYTVSLLGGQNGVVFEAAKILKQKFPELKVVWVAEELFGARGAQQSPPSTLHLPLSDFLFVALGAPRQEKWIDENLPQLPVKVAMGVGGAFDFISGRIQRAPYFLQRLGLEWLWRLMLQPWRIKRQFTLLKFVLLVAKERFKK